MRIRVKIAGSYILVLGAMIFLTLFTIMKVDDSFKALEFIKSGVSVSKEEMTSLKIDIIQIQQWLTDASATGFTDGFKEAEKFYLDANKRLDNDISRKSKAGKKELVAQLTAIKKQLAEYYSTGVTMAHEYIDNGREAGNAWMEKFDPVAEKLTGMVDEQLEIRNSVFSKQFSNLSNNQLGIVKVLIIISIVIFVVIAGMGIHIFVSFKRGMNIIEKFSKKLATNNISEDITVKRNDEFGKTAVSFKKSLGGLRNLVKRVKLSTEKTSGIKSSLVASAEETAAAISNIRNSITLLLQEIERMDGNVSENAAAVEEITANINSIDKQISEQAAMVEQSTASIIEMISSLDSVNEITKKKTRAIENLVKAMKDGNDASSATDEVFEREVTDRIDGISEMAEVIQSIASQTNLLSMNAAIEAAHAGEAGKGFAVVADEIRKLADNSAQSSANIAKTIKEIEEGIVNTGKVAQRKVEAFRVMNKEIEETRNAFSEISSSIQEVTSGGAQIQKAMVVLQDVSENIRNATSEMASGIKQVSDSQIALKELSADVAGGMMEIRTGSEEIAAAADEMVEFSSSLDTIVDELKTETDKFII